MIRLKRLYAHDFKQLREVEMTFPGAGRVLVQGRNEAGKSTLFEAIFFALFGQALATENAGKPNLDDLIGYEKNKARVELDLAVGDRLFRVTRTLNRGKANVWQLDIIDGERTQEVRGNRAVNDRLVAELGFDSEALLNTCFVEQKKLEKLEGLNKGKREESLSKLLNLERLLELEEKFKLHVEDERMLARLLKRVELAESQQQLPTAEQDLSHAEGELQLIELRAQVIRAAEEKRAAQGLDEQLRQMQARRAELTEAVSQVDALDKARHSMKTALDRFDLVAQQTASLETMCREQAETQRAVTENVPALDKRALELGRLLRHLARVNQVQAARGSAQSELQRFQTIQRELEILRGRHKTLEAAIAETEVRARQLDAMLHNYDIGDALGDWATLAREVSPETTGEKTLAEKTHARAQASARLRAGVLAPGLVLIVLVSATVFVPLALLYWTHSAGWAAGAGTGLVVADAALAILLTRRALRLWDDLERTTAELGQLQGEVNVRREIVGNLSDRLNAAQARLADLGAPIPSSPEAAQTRRIEIAAALENKTRDELNAERDAVREKLNYTRAQRDEVLSQIQDLQSGTSEDAEARSHRVIEKSTHLLEFWQPLLARRAADLQVEPDVLAVREARQGIASEQKNWQTRIQQAAKLGAQIEEGQARISKTSSDLQMTYDSASALLNGAVPVWDSTLPRDAYMNAGRKLTEAFKAKGGEQVRSQLTGLEKEIGACERELKLRDQAAQDAILTAQAILQSLGIDEPLSAEAALEELDGFAGRLHQVQLDDRPKLQARVKSLQMRVGALRGTRDRLERELGLQGEEIDLEGARVELDKERRSQEERKLAVEIVMRARKRIVQKILPATMDYMRRILPQLTRDRYHDAELDPETYKIRVWDERAGQSGAWKEKNIFSGGTKDQFSLALRLAFALATLPQERGTSPGFIFLDEPLGSFDDERASALLYLLTDGEIARAFDQIFLISHVRVQEDRFTHRVVLENGVVKESNLNPANF